MEAPKAPPPIKKKGFLRLWWVDYTFDSIRRNMKYTYVRYLYKNMEPGRGGAGTVESYSSR
jgi:hypothetical protein